MSSFTLAQNAVACLQDQHVDVPVFNTERAIVALFLGTEPLGGTASSSSVQSDPIKLLSGPDPSADGLSMEVCAWHRPSFYLVLNAVEDECMTCAMMTCLYHVRRSRSVSVPRSQQTAAAAGHLRPPTWKVSSFLLPAPCLPGAAFKVSRVRDDAYEQHS
jgi:hypothetical protein